MRGYVLFLSMQAKFLGYYNLVITLENSTMFVKKIFNHSPWQVWAIIFVAVIVQLILFSYKELLHVDEIFSFGTANGDNGVFMRYSSEEYDNQFFYSHDFKNYLLLQNSSFADMWHRLRLDTHMPLYFVLLRLFSLPFAPEFSLVPAMLLNILSFVVFLFGVYRLLMTLFDSQRLAVVGLLIIAFMLPVLSLAVFFRMYMLWMSCCVYLLDYICRYVRYTENRQSDLVGIGVFCFLQIFTHFYGLFFGFVLTFGGCLLFFATKRYKQMFLLAGVMLISVLCAVAIFPEMIEIGLHGERGVQFRARLPEFVSSFGTILKFQMPLFIQTLFGHSFVAAFCFIVFCVVVFLAIKKNLLSLDERFHLALLCLSFVLYGFLSALFQPFMGGWQIRYFAPIIVIEAILGIYMVMILCRYFKLKPYVFYLFLYFAAFVSAVYSATCENQFWAKKNEVYPRYVYQRFENLFNKAHIWWGLGGGWSPVWMMHIVADKFMNAEQVFVLSDLNDPKFFQYAKKEQQEGKYAYYFLPYTQEQMPAGAVAWIKEKTGRNSYYLFTFRDKKYESFLAASVFLVAPY